MSYFMSNSGCSFLWRQQFVCHDALGLNCYIGSRHLERVAMAERLSRSLSKLGLAGQGNGNGDGEETPGQPAEDNADKSQEGNLDGCVSQPSAVATYNFMLDLSVPGHFPTQSAARRYLHNILRLGWGES